MRTLVIAFLSTPILALAQGTDSEHGQAAAPPMLVVPSASEARADVADLSLEEMLNTKITIATRTKQTLRESPGVITVVTRDEILNSGARDLVDVLRLVPGFSFGTDVQGVVGLSFRGNFAQEGKALLLVDGQEMNELLYSTLQFGHHYPIDNLERVEIIRGPGSVSYGGSAELAVINLITRSAEQLEGGNVTLRGGTFPSAVGHRRVSVGAGQTFGAEKDVGVSVLATLNDSIRSDDRYTDFLGAQTLGARDSQATSGSVNAAMRVKDLSARLIFDRYSTLAPAGFGLVDRNVAVNEFTTLIGDLQYRWQLGDRLTITPRFNYRNITPWEEKRVEHPVYYSKGVSRTLGGLQAAYRVVDGMDLTAGLEAYYDRAWLKSLDLVGFQRLWQNGEPTISFYNVAGYSQLLWENPIVNLTVGARLENHSQFGGSFVPRIGLTKVVDAFHAKLLWSNAFRAPALENMRLNEDIRPERTRVFEAEVGYQLTDSMFVGMNAFDIQIRNPIIYFFDQGTGEESYQNFASTGSRGVELDYRLKNGRNTLQLTYALAVTAGLNRVERYEVPGEPNFVLGIPHHKATLNATWNAVGSLYINPSAIWSSEAFGYLTGDDTGGGAGVLALQPASLLLNLFVSYRSLVVPGLDIGVGAYNLLNRQVPYLQAYNGGHAPLPGSRRELVARVSYSLPIP